MSTITRSTTTDRTADESEARLPIIRRLLDSQVAWLCGALIAIIIVFSSMTNGQFLDIVNVRNIATDAAILLLIAVGMTFVIITAGIDLSVGSVLVFSQVLAAKVMLSLDGSVLTVLAVGMIVSICCGIAWGAVNGALIGFLRVPPLIATLGTMGAAQGFALLITNGTDVRGIPDQAVTGLGNGRLWGQIPYLVIIAVGVAVALGIILRATRFGRYTYVIGSNEAAARKAGIRVRVHLVKVYALSGALAGLAGVLSLARFSTTTIAGHTTENLNAVAAVVIGGTSLFGGIGSVLGTVVGVFIPSVLQYGFILVGMRPFWQQVAVAVVLVIAVYLDQVRRRKRT